jgi:hypothetical protein
MSQTERSSSKRAEALETLSEEDRVWLTKRLAKYRVLLEYLHTN